MFVLQENKWNIVTVLKICILSLLVSITRRQTLLLRLIFECFQCLFSPSLLSRQKLKRLDVILKKANLDKSRQLASAFWVLFCFSEFCRFTWPNSKIKYICSLETSFLFSTITWSKLWIIGFLGIGHGMEKLCFSLLFQFLQLWYLHAGRQGVGCTNYLRLTT